MNMSISCTHNVIEMPSRVWPVDRDWMLPRLNMLVFAAFPLADLSKTETPSTAWNIATSTQIREAAWRRIRALYHSSDAACGRWAMPVLVAYRLNDRRPPQKQTLVVLLNDFRFIIDALWMISSLSEVNVYY